MMSRISRRRAIRLASLLGIGAAAAVVAATMTPMSGCCGGPPTSKCQFTEVIDGGADASLICGTEVCDPSTTQCCYQEAGPVFMCLPLDRPCPGQTATCDGDEDCVFPDGGGFLHCCGVMATNQIRCQGVCGIPGSSTVLLCHQDSDCPPNLPSCALQAFGGRQIQACGGAGR
jgi:hypothetical protein